MPNLPTCATFSHNDQNLLVGLSKLTGLENNTQISNVEKNGISVFNLTRTANIEAMGQIKFPLNEVKLLLKLSIK